MRPPVLTGVLPIVDPTSVVENPSQTPAVPIQSSAGAEAAEMPLPVVEPGPSTSPLEATASSLNLSVDPVDHPVLIPMEQLRLGQRLESGIGHDVYIGSWLSRIWRVMRIQLTGLDAIPAPAMTEILKGAESLRSLRHDRLLRFCGVCEPKPFRQTNAQIWLVTELEPVSLRSVLQGRDPRLSLDPALAHRIVHGILEALVHLHASGHSHLDLRPENVLLHEGTQVALSDYGIPGLLRELSKHIGADALVGGGTHGYRAPEQISSGQRDAVSAAADIFAFAMIAVELFTGERSMADRPPMQLAYDLLVEQREIVFPQLLPIEWRPVLQRCVALNPGERPTSREVLRDMLGLRVSYY
jgi:serine/threonine protein kinase